MKKLLGIVVALFIAAPASAGIFDLKPLAEFAAEKIGETKATTIIDLNAKVAGGLTLPIFTLHTKSNMDLLELGVGGVIKEGGHKTATASVLFNLPSIAERLLRGKWFQEHVRQTNLPPIWFGPYARVPFPYETWTIKNDLGVMINIGLGGD